MKLFNKIFIIFLFSTLSIFAQKIEQTEFYNAVGMEFTFVKVLMGGEPNSVYVDEDSIEAAYFYDDGSFFVFQVLDGVVKRAANGLLCKTFEKAKNIYIAVGAYLDHQGFELVSVYGEGVLVKKGTLYVMSTLQYNSIAKVYRIMLVAYEKSD